MMQLLSGADWCIDKKVGHGPAIPKSTNHHTPTRSWKTWQKGAVKPHNGGQSMASVVTYFYVTLVVPLDDNKAPPRSP